MNRKVSKLLILAVCHLSIAIGCLHAQTGTWTKVTNNAPYENMGVCLLMTDGTVICHDTNGTGLGTGWEKLTPDIHGSYINGTWSTIASNAYDRLFFSSQVLPSGKVYVAGGEYGAGNVHGEVYDPVADAWTTCGPIPNSWNIYDGNSELLYNGNILEGPQIGSHTSYNILQWSPATLNYTQEADAPLNHDEAEWLKLPDSSVLYVGISTTNSNRFIPQTNTWVNDGTLPVNIWDGLQEAGAALMLPNGKAIFFGATEHNAIYTPSGNTSPGTWAAAADFPTINGSPMGQSDASAAMMVNGKILCAVAPVYNGNNSFGPPCYFLEYDYITNTFTQVKNIIPGVGGDSIPVIGSYQTQMLDLPDGNVLVSISQDYGFSVQYFIYTPGSGPIPQGKPTIDNVFQPTCGIYKVRGKLFNGISEGAAYGDDWQMSTNYPIVRLTNGSNVYYATTSNWNRIGAVQTDSLEDTAQFALPATLPSGTYSLVVIANGFASNPTLFTYVPFDVSATVTANVTCDGQSNGNATATVSGGIAPYTYNWSIGSSTVSTSNPTGPILSAGTYVLTVTDSAGCSETAGITIAQPNAISITIDSVVNVTCSGLGSVTANPATGGTPPFTYAWTPSGGTNLTATGLSAGSYTITATDIRGCTGSLSVPILQLGGITAAAITISNERCNGESMGSVSSSGSGGTTPYTYAWSAGGTNAVETGLSAGTYTVTVKDNNGCTAMASTTITQPILLNVIATATSNELCNGENIGSASSTVSGGTPPYTYTWTGGSTNSTESGLTAGSYTINVTDNNGCTATASTDVTEPALLTATVNVITNAGCNGNSGSLSSSVAGGTSPYTYTWTGGSTNSTLSALSAGTYTLGVTDANGCGATASASITQPLNLMVTATVNSNVLCNGGATGSATASPSGGTSPYTYAWTNGNTNATVSGLSAGTYTVNINDFDGCTATAAVTITQPVLLTATASVTSNASCNGESNGSVSSTPSGGTSPYTYLWTGGYTNSSVSGLSAGTYTVNITDNNGCMATTATIIIQPNALVITQGSTTTTAGNCFGSAWVTVSGGTPGYNYSWSPGGATTDSINQLCQGSYCCRITDAHGCKDSVCVNVVTGIEAISNASSIQIYPDPNNGNFTISGLMNGQIVELYNYLGQMMEITAANNSTLHFNISDKTDGIYLIRILNKDGSLVAQKKILKTE